MPDEQVPRADDAEPASQAGGDEADDAELAPRTTGDEAAGRTVRPASSRRSFLARTSVLGLAAAGGLLLAPSPPDGPATVDAADDGGVAALPDERGDVPAPHAPVSAPFQGERIVDEDDAPIARYHYKRTRDGYVPTAPINVVFPLPAYAVGLPAVMAIFEEAGWSRRVEEYARYAWDRERERYVHQMATAAESHLGLHGRLHVRCWEFEGVVSLQAHEDAPARPRHAITSYADGRAAVESLFRGAGWRVASERVDLANDRDPDHDGAASIIVPGSDSETGIARVAR